MYLKSLEISGFKSFAKKANLEFNCPITAIVGPNGSGKSNVAEAFRFVLGEQSIKSMRGKKGEDLIFNGGKTMGKLNRASVKLVFDNTKKILNVDFDEVTLERAVHRDGINEYFLNGSQVRLRDIIELLAGAHIGSSGHHIISQGEADKILNANLRERREMVEDALGLKIYHYKKSESEKKLEKTAENIKSVESLRREIAPHLKFLAKQVEKVEKAREMRDRLGVLYKEYFKREQTYIEHEKGRLAGEKKGPLEKKHMLEKELAHAKEVLEKAAGKDHKSEKLLSLERVLSESRISRDELVRESGRIEGAITSLKRTIEKQQALMQGDENKLIPLKDVEAFSVSLDKELEMLGGEDDLSALKRALAALRDRVRSFLKTNATHVENTFTKDAEIEIEKLVSEKKDLEEKVADAAHKERETQAEYMALQQEIEKEKDSNRDAEKAVFRIMAELNEVTASLQYQKIAEDRLNIIEADWKRELGEAGALIGREIMDFAAVELRADNNDLESAEITASEPREKQEERRKVIERIKIRLEDAGAGGGEDILKEYKDAEDRDAFLAREIADLEKSAEALRALIAELTEKLDVEFKQGVQKINTEFNKFFSLMFGGGEASLSVIAEKKRKRRDTDLDLEEGDGEEMTEDEETEEGIDIAVSLPHKRTKGLVMLSGGERALTSIALLFAISQVNPPPFVILDETDAALDEANSKKYGDMIESLSKYSQLILITHNRETMSRAGVLYGVTMGAEGFSKLLSIQFDEALAVAK